MLKQKGETNERQIKSVRSCGCLRFHGWSDSSSNGSFRNSMANSNLTSTRRSHKLHDLRLRWCLLDGCARKRMGIFDRLPRPLEKNSSASVFFLQFPSLLVSNILGFR